MPKCWQVRHFSGNAGTEKRRVLIHKEALLEEKPAWKELSGDTVMLNRNECSADQLGIASGSRHFFFNLSQVIFIMRSSSFIPRDVKIVRRDRQKKDILIKNFFDEQLNFVSADLCLKNLDSLSMQKRIPLRKWLLAETRMDKYLCFLELVAPRTLVPPRANMLWCEATLQTLGRMQWRFWGKHATNISDIPCEFSSGILLVFIFPSHI